MPENLYCPGQKVTNGRYDEGYYRTFRKPPELGKPVRSMLDEFVNMKEYDKVVMFFMGYAGADYDYACFLLGELIRGDL